VVFFVGGGGGGIYGDVSPSVRTDHFTQVSTVINLSLILFYLQFVEGPKTSTGGACLYVSTTMRYHSLHRSKQRFSVDNLTVWQNFISASLPNS
jgi:hypothetical protein